MRWRHPSFQYSESILHLYPIFIQYISTIFNFIQSLSYIYSIYIQSLSNKYPIFIQSKSTIQQNVIQSHFNLYHNKVKSQYQCFGSGSGRIRIIWSDPDPDPYHKTLIWIRVAPKINQNHGINKSKWFVNVLFTWRKFLKIIFNKLMFTFI